MRKLRVLAVCRPDQLPPDTLEGLSEKQIYSCKTEYDVFSTLQRNGHELRESFGLSTDGRRSGLPAGRKHGCAVQFDLALVWQRR